MLIYNESEEEKIGQRMNAKKFITHLLMHNVDPTLIYDRLVEEGYTEEEIKEARRHSRDKGIPIPKPLKIAIKNYFRIYIIIFIIAISITLLAFLFTQFQAWPEEGNFTYQPTIEAYSQKENIIIEKGENTFYLTPKGTYNATVMVAHTKYYVTGPAAPISPIDIMFVWGFITNEDYTRNIKFSQSNRAGRFKLKRESPYNVRYVDMHSSNNHIIPANDEIKKEILNVRKHEIISIEGYVVTASSPGRLDPWGTSMDPTDKECEVIYVNKVVIDGIIYD